MNKSDLIKAILNKNNKYKISEIENIVDLFLEKLEKLLHKEKGLKSGVLVPSLQKQEKKELV